MRAHWLVAVVVGCNLGVIACEPSEPVNINKKDSGADVPQNTTGTGGSGTGGSGTGGAGTGGSGGNGSGGAGTGGSGGGTGGAGTGGSGGNPDAGSVDTPADSPGGDDGGNPDAAADQAPGDDVPPAADVMPDMGMLDDAGFPIGATIGSCAPLNWTVSASASATADQPPNAIDGVLTTRWSTGAAQAAGMYYQIDFGGYVRLSQIKLNNTGSPGDHPRGFEVLASPDGIDFSTMVATGTPGDTAPADNLVTIDFDPRAIRFLRIGMTGASGSWWSIHEVGVTCQIPDGNGGFTTDVVPDDLRCGPGTDGGVPDAGAGDPFNRALWTLSASSTSALPADIISHATDGDIATRWSNGVLQVPGQFFKVDMGSVGCIGQIRMVASALDFVAAYKVSVSVDDVKYIAVAKGVGANVLQIRVPPHLARYVRIDQTGTANAWWSIDELTITP